MGAPLIDESGNKYGTLFVINSIRRPNDRKTMWLCECECGNTIVCSGSDLRTGKRRSCGNHCNSIKNEIGNTYGFLTVLKKDEIPANQFADRCVHWICKCGNCGEIISVSGRSLRNGDTQSCGCIKSLGEQYIKKFLNTNNFNYEYQKEFDNLISAFSDKKLSFDFAILENDNIDFLIEFQGNQHYQQVKYFGNKLDKIKTNDDKKLQYCLNNNIPVLYICVKKNHRPDFSQIPKIIKEYKENKENVKISIKCI